MLVVERGSSLMIEDDSADIAGKKISPHRGERTRTRGPMRPYGEVLDWMLKKFWSSVDIDTTCCIT